MTEDGDGIVILSRTWLAPDGTEESSTVTFEALPDGGIRLTGEDIGPSVEDTWGSDDQEYILTLPRSTVVVLTAELFRAAFRTDTAMTIGSLRKMCEQRGLAHEFEIW